MADLVIDASLASAWCFPDERTEYTNGVLQAVSDSFEAFAPRLWAYEVRNSVLIGLRRGRISRGDAEGFLDSLADLNIHLVDPVSYDAVFKIAETQQPDRVRRRISGSCHP
jgi:predicted nucleic acid-binding protein